MKAVYAFLRLVTPFYGNGVLLLLLFSSLPNASASPPPGYYLVWSDEFNGTSLDPTKWWAWIGPSESAVNTTDAINVSGGYLTITTYTTNAINYSAIISSDGLFRARYGYYESSILFSDTPGEWSAYWLQSPTEGEFIGDPSESGVEVDVCEHRYSDAGNVDVVSNSVQTSVHWDGYGTGEQTATSGLIGSGLGTGFHTYGFVWTTTNYSFAFDGTQEWNTTSGQSARTEILMFSQEVQSNGWAGITPAGGYGNLQTSTTKMVVDYIRYYAPTSMVFWTGTSSAAWSDAGNWVSNMIPTSASDAVFGYLSLANFNAILPTNISVNSLSIQECSPVSISGGSLTVNAGGVDMLSAINNAVIASPVVLGANQNWSIRSGYALTLTGLMTGPANLNITGRGTVSLAGTNLCTGFTTVSNGLFYIGGLAANAINVSGGTLDVAGFVSGPVQVNVNGTLEGTGIMTGPVQINSGGTLAPGPSFGTLTISNTLMLQPGSVTSVDVNETTRASDQIIGLSNITYNGTLLINNQSGTFAPGDSFKLFDAQNYSGAFGRIVPLTPGTNLAWDTSTLAIDGTLRVATTIGTNISAALAGNQMTLSWPNNNLGWLLQAQTNIPAGVGLTANWTPISGSSLTNQITINVNPNISSAFYRLVSPSFTTAKFSHGDLVVLQVGNGSIASTGAPGFLNDYLPSGGPLQVQVALPKTGSSALIFGGSSYDGALSVSANGQYIVIAGYNVPTGFSSGAIDSSSTTGASAVPRAVGLMDRAGNFTLGATTTKFSGGTIRSAASDGSGNYWAGGGLSGIVYLGNNSPSTTVSSVSSATRNLGFVNGSLYFTETGSGDGVMAFSGAPKVAATPALPINTAGTGTGTPSPKGFAINTNLTIAYVADNRSAANGGGIQRFNWNGSSWVYAYTIGYALSSSKEIYDVIADFSGPNPVLYGTTGEASANKVVTVTDTGAASTYSILETAPSGDAFRGIVFAP